MLSVSFHRIEFMVRAFVRDGITAGKRVLGGWPPEMLLAHAMWLDTPAAETLAFARRAMLQLDELGAG
jgi:hypothetical protein